METCATKLRPLLFTDSHTFEVSRSATLKILTAALILELIIQLLFIPPIKSSSSERAPPEGEKKMGSKVK
jgi:hypothetical protein